MNAPQSQIAYTQVISSYSEFNSQLNFAKTPESLNHSDEYLNDLITQQQQTLSASDFKRLKSEFFEFGPLDELLENEQITEILVNSADDIYFESEGKIHRHEDRFFSESSYFDCCKRLIEVAGIQLTLNFPFGNGRFKDWRVHAICPPVCSARLGLSLRRIPKNTWTLQKLFDCNFLTSQQQAYLQNAIHDKKNFIICGSTGTGKTSLLSACLEIIPGTERIVVIEDTPEVHLPNCNSIRLVTRKDHQESLLEISSAELIKQSLRMRPDRIILGEVRGEEAKDLLLANSTGHRGSIASLHAHDAQGALRRLQLLTQMGAPQWSTKMVQNLIFDSVDFVVTIERTNNGSRFIQEICEINSLEENGFTLNPI